MAKEPVVRSATDLLHELQAYLIELEMQNEVLRRAHAAFEESRDIMWRCMMLLLSVTSP